jgi:uncharacterized protein (TIGR03067 family)
MRFCAPLVLLVAPLMAAETPKEEAAKKDLAKMQGGWVLVSLEEDGKTATEARCKVFKVSIEGARYVFTVGGVTAKGFSKPDPTTKPKALDIVVEEDPHKGKTKPAIYDFDGDKFLVAVAEPGKDRPKGFTAGAGYDVEVWKREKP